MKSHLISLACLLSFCSIAAHGGSLVLRTAAQHDSAPKFISTTQGGTSGICVEIFKAIERLDPSLQITGYQQILPLSRLENMVKSGSLDLFCGLGSSADRRQQFIFVQPPIYQVNYQLAVRANDKVEISNWGDVRKLGDKGVILVNRGSGAIQRLKELGGLQIDDSANNNEQNYRKLVAGRARFYYYRSPGFTESLRQQGMEGLIRILPASMESTPFYILFGQHVDDTRLRRFEAALQQLKSSGELEKIVQRYD